MLERKPSILTSAHTEFWDQFNSVQARAPVDYERQPAPIGTPHARAFRPWALVALLAALILSPFAGIVLWMALQ